MGIEVVFHIRIGEKDKFVKQTAPLLIMVKGFKEAVKPKGCLNDFDFFTSDSPKGKTKKMKQTDIFKPGSYVTLLEK